MSRMTAEGEGTRSTLGLLLPRGFISPGIRLHPPLSGKSAALPLTSRLSFRKMHVARRPDKPMRSHSK